MFAFNSNLALLEIESDILFPEWILFEECQTSGKLFNASLIDPIPRLNSPCQGQQSWGCSQSWNKEMKWLVYSNSTTKATSLWNQNLFGQLHNAGTADSTMSDVLTSYSMGKEL